MAVATSLSISIDPKLHFHHHSHSRFFPKPRPISFLPKSRRRCLKSPDDDPFNLSSSSPSNSTTLTQTEEDPEPRDPFGTDRILTKDEYEKLKSLESFSYREELGSGSLHIRVMRTEEIYLTVKLIAESFAELWGFPKLYVKFLGVSVMHSLAGRRAALPHVATLVGFYRGRVEDGEGGEEELAGTVEVIFDEKGASFPPPTPTPSTPKDKPYIGNMAVKKGLRSHYLGAVCFLHHCQSRFLPNPNPFKAFSPRPLLLLPKSHRPCFKSSFFPSDNAFPLSSPSPSPSTSTASLPPEEDPEPTSLPQGPFLTNEEYEKLKFLENFSYRVELGSGFLCVRVMRPEDTDATAKLLADSFAESMWLMAFLNLLGFLLKELMWLHVAFLNLLGFLEKQYLTKIRAPMPHAATLVGFFRGKVEEDGGEGAEELAGTVEVSFNEKGATSSHKPIPPMDKPYICSMAVKKHLRRRGIGRHLLKASEKLISEMTPSKEVYLHCRLMDAAPLNMYTKAGYSPVKTDSIFTLLTLERRKHLMCKNLPIVDDGPEPDISGAEEET